MMVIKFEMEMLAGMMMMMSIKASLTSVLMPGVVPAV